MRRGLALFAAGLVGRDPVRRGSQTELLAGVLYGCRIGSTPANSFWAWRPCCWTVAMLASYLPAAAARCTSTPIRALRSE